MLRPMEAERAGALANSVRRRWPSTRRGGSCGPSPMASRPHHRACRSLRPSAGLATGFELLANARREYLAWGATAKSLNWIGRIPLRRRTDLPGESDADPAEDVCLAMAQCLALELDRSAGDRPHKRELGNQHRRFARPSRTRPRRNDGRHRGTAGLVGRGPPNLVATRTRRAYPPRGIRRQPPDDADVHGAPVAQRLTDLVVADVMCDGRFAGDPYFADVDRCSLVALPILSRGMLRAVMLVENRLMRGAFTAEWLDAVNLIAGQLAVSLDNASCIPSLRRRVRGWWRPGIELVARLSGICMMCSAAAGVAGVGAR